MNKKNLKIGDLVESLKGRDEGRIYMIYKIIDKAYISLVDGNYKKIQNPKLKKLKHIKLLNINLDKISNKLQNDVKVFDSEIYSAIKKALEK